MSDEEYRLFSEWLVEEYGLEFGPEKRDILRARLEPRRAALGLESFEQLYFHVKFHPRREEEREKLLHHLTNNESYFFRERPQLEVFRDVVLPALRERREGTPDHTIRILSAACSHGQEPYTLAILVHESGLFPAPWNVVVTGLDIDTDALERAREGVYNRNAFRGQEPADLRERHFQQVGEEAWRIADSFRRGTRFVDGNLVDPGWPARVGRQDVIFCRNALIYFTDEAIRRAARNLHDALAPEGYLFLGHAETLSRVPTRLVTERHPGAVFYRRTES